MEKNVKLYLESVIPNINPDLAERIAMYVSFMEDSISSVNIESNDKIVELSTENGARICASIVEEDTFRVMISKVQNEISLVLFMFGDNPADLANMYVEGQIVDANRGMYLVGSIPIQLILSSNDKRYVSTEYYSPTMVESIGGTSLNGSFRRFAEIYKVPATSLRHEYLGFDDESVRFSVLSAIEESERIFAREANKVAKLTKEA